MIRINLLPHREEKRQARRKQFFALLALVVVVSGAVWFAGKTLIDARISEQEERNNFLRTEIATLDKEIAEIQKLKQQTEALLSRKRVIEALQSNRTETVHLFNELIRQVPEGIYLKTLKQTGQKLTLVGHAQSNARITTLMNNLDATNLLDGSRLIETRADTVGGRRMNTFSIETKFAVQTSDSSKGKAGEKKPGAAKP